MRGRTNSEERGDMERAKALGVLDYLVKPTGFERMLESAKKIVSLARTR